MAAPKPCMECGERPKHAGRHRCIVCFTRSADITFRISEARRRSNLVPDALRKKTVPAKHWPEGSRWCAGCQSFVLLIDCPKSGSRCKSCTSAASHAAMTAKTYGLDGHGYEQLFKLQGGKCAICRSRPIKKRLAVDHDHGSGAVRGLLCGRCNHELLGAGWDSINVLAAALAYLATPPATGGWLAPEEDGTAYLLQASRDDAPTGRTAPHDPLDDLFMSPDERVASARATSGPAEDGGCKQLHYLPVGSKRDASGKFWKILVEPGDPAPF